MIYNSTRLIAQAMDNHNFKYSVEEQEDRSLIVAGYRIQSGNILQVKFISQSKDNDVAIRLFCLVNSVSEDKVEKTLKILNACNCKYRYLRFVLDNDRDINVEYDIPEYTSDDCIGEIACEIFARIMSIVDDCYPMIMREMWT